VLCVKAITRDPGLQTPALSSLTLQLVFMFLGWAQVRPMTSRSVFWTLYKYLKLLSCPTFGPHYKLVTMFYILSKYYRVWITDLMDFLSLVDMYKKPWIMNIYSVWWYDSQVSYTVRWEKYLDVGLDLEEKYIMM